MPIDRKHRGTGAAAIRESLPVGARTPLRAILAAVVAAAAILLATPAVASAVEFTVDKTDGELSSPIGACSPADDDDCSLHDAVFLANLDPDTADQILFELPASSTINLEENVPALQGTVDIIGSREGVLRTTISGQDTRRVFTVTDDAVVTISSLILTEGRHRPASGEGQGGAVFIGAEASFELIDSDITDSVANGISGSGSGAGGAIFAREGSQVTITRSELRGNTAKGLVGSPSFGGALAGLNGGSTGSFVVNASTLSDNRAIGNGSQGGAILASRDLTVNDSTLTRNSTSGSSDDGEGGAIASVDDELLVANTTIHDNSSGEGGGIFDQDGGGPRDSIDSATISENETSGGPGGGIGAAGTMALTNTIVADNTADGAGADLDGDFDARRSLIEAPASATLIVDLENIKGQDPALGPLLRNGAQTRTQAIASSSPAFDAGGTILFTDQRGVRRPKEGADDIGAFELDLPPTVTITSGPPDRSADDAPVFRFSTPVRDFDRFECALAGSPYTACISGQQQFGSLDDGTYTFMVRAKDTAGNFSPPDQATFTIDTTGPPAAIDSAPAASSDEDSPEIAFSSADPDGDLESFECSLNGGDYQGCTSPADLGPLADGDYTFRVRAIDDLDNRGEPATATFTVDADGDGNGNPGGGNPGGGNPGGGNPGGGNPPPTTDTRVTDFDVTAKKRQKQKGRRIKVKVSAAAGEAVSAKAVGKIKIKGKKGSFRLKREREQIERGERNVFRLKLAGKKKKVKRSERKIKRAIRKYNNASGKRKRKIAIKAPVRVVATDAAGNRAVEKRVVTLK